MHVCLTTQVEKPSLAVLFCFIFLFSTILSWLNRQECHHCSILKHPNIVRFIGVYYPKKDSNISAMIMELTFINNLVAHLEVKHHKESLDEMTCIPHLATFRLKHFILLLLI